MPVPVEPSVMLLAKAVEDANLAVKLKDDATVSDEYIGFFCQQAVEKGIKSVLSRKRILFRWTHDLAQLVALLEENGLTLPCELGDCVSLTPFAAVLRYDRLPEDQGEHEAFDRAGAVRMASAAVAWADALFGGD